jgi:hypothetical protein
MGSIKIELIFCGVGLIFGHALKHMSKDSRQKHKPTSVFYTFRGSGVQGFRGSGFTENLGLAKKARWRSG